MRATCSSSERFASASMIGPMSVESLRRIADGELVHRAREHREHAVGDLVLNAEHAQRRAALAGAVERGADDVVDDLLGQRRSVDDHRVLAAGLRDQRQVAALRERAVDARRHVGRAGEYDTRDARIRDELCADRFAGAGQELQRCARNAGLVQDPRRFVGDQRRLLRGLRDDRIARGERAGDLADEDRQREVPRTDRDDRAERRRRLALAQLPRVVAAEVGGFADFADGVHQRLARFADRQMHERRARALPADPRRVRGSPRARSPAARSMRGQRSPTPRAPLRRRPASRRRPLRRRHRRRPASARAVRRRRARAPSASNGCAE